MIKNYYLITNGTIGRFLHIIRDAENKTDAIMKADKMLNIEANSAKEALYLSSITSARLTNGKKDIADWMEYHNGLQIRRRYLYDFYEKNHGTMMSPVSAFRDKDTIFNMIDKFKREVLSVDDVDTVQMLIHEVDENINIIDTDEVGFFRNIMGKFVLVEKPPLF